jgi:hypothetical protein
MYCFTSRSRIFHIYGDVTITGEGLQNLGLSSAFRASEQGGILIVPHPDVTHVFSILIEVSPYSKVSLNISTMSYI